MTITEKVRTSLRISSNALDGEIDDQIGAALADMEMCGIKNPNVDDPLILNAVKLFCRAGMTDDTAKASAFMTAYNDMKACLMIATGYGRKD